MNNYLVQWEIDAYAPSPVAAAMYALGVQRKPDSHAVVFDVLDDCGNTTRVDLLTDEGLTPEELRTRYGTDHPDHPRFKWREDVVDDVTIRGYWDWVAAQIESD